MKLKRLISAVSAAAILLSAAVPAYAEGKNTKTKEGLELPFELTAPEAVFSALAAPSVRCCCQVGRWHGR